MPKIGRTKKTMSMTKVETTQSRKSIRSDNLHISLSPSTFRKARGSSSRSSARSRSRTSTTKSVNVAPIDRQGLLKQAGPSTVVPTNAAVHFANFYNSPENSASLYADYRNKILNKPEPLIRDSPKTEFTRQMVYKLEHSAGTEYYGRQVSALLEETVEPPGFSMRLPPADNCAPLNKHIPYYPLWYKDPNKMPQSVTEQYRAIKEKFGNVALKNLGISQKIEESSGSEAEARGVSDNGDNWEPGTESESVNGTIVGTKDSVTSGISGRSGKTGKSVVSNQSAKSKRSSEYDSDFDLESEEEEDDEEGSSGWETESSGDENVNITVSIK